MGYPKDRVRSKAMPPNLVTLFAHVMSRANEGGRGATAHGWDEVLQSTSSTGSSSQGPFPMSVQDWRKAEAFSVHLQSLIAARQSRDNPNGQSQLSGHNGNCSTESFSSSSSCSSSSAGSTAAAASCTKSSSSTSSSGSGKPVPHANGKVKGRARPAAAHTPQPADAADATSVAAGAAAAGAATPNPGAAWSRHHFPRVTPKEICRAGEPSAPTKSVGRVAASRRVNGGADGAVASLAVSQAGPGAFETPSHSSHHVAPPGAPAGANQRGREHSPSRYPARLRSRRFPQLGGTGESPEPPQPRGFGHEASAMGDGDQTQGARRLSPSPRGHHQQSWLGPIANGGLAHQLDRRDDGGDDGQGYGMRTRAAPKAAHELGSVVATPSGSSTPQVSTGTLGSPPPVANFRPAPPPVASAVASGGPSRKPEAVPRPRQVLQGGRSGARATPVPRSSVGGRNYTDNHVKQLGLIEASVVASATPKDRAMYNLPRQGRTLTLTNVFKFVALRGAGAMYRLATDKQVEAHTGRHSNFFDGKIDARIVGVIKKDIGDEAITKSRKFSKILLSLVAEGCTHPDCDWDHNSFTSDKIANFQARLEAETGTSALKFCSEPVSLSNAAVAAAAAASNKGASSTPSSPAALATYAGAGASAGQANGAPSKRRLDLGRDGGQTPSPRVKKLKRDARSRLTGLESTPTAEGNGNSKSPPKEEDDMRAAEVLQGLKGLGAPTG